MASSTEPNSGIYHSWDLGENAWKAQMDANLKLIGRVGFQLSVIDRHLTSPPGSPSDGDRYIVASVATGDWTGMEGMVAVYDGDLAAWVFYAPSEGWGAWVIDEGVRAYFTGGAWVAHIDVLGAHGVHYHVRKASAGTIAAGLPVYVAGYNVGGSYVEVEAADASDPAKMPAIGIAMEPVTNTATSQVGQIGIITDLDTSAFSDQDIVYVAPGGGLTVTKPTGANGIQKIAVVSRAHASAGILYVGTGRQNDVPNIAEDKIWIGDSSGVAVPVDFFGLLPGLVDNATAAQLTLTDTGINIANIPTSASGLSAGDVWSNSGVLTIV